MEESHLLQMRGLKHRLVIGTSFVLPVASFTDAWIETWDYLGMSVQQVVASFTDAWIETSNAIIALFGDMRRIFYRCVD